MIFLMEVKKKIVGMKKVKLKLGFVNGFYVQRQGKGGGLAIFWRKEVNLEMKSYSRHHIDAVVTEERIWFQMEADRLLWASEDTSEERIIEVS